jgi:hypothetical protein
MAKREQDPSRGSFLLAEELLERGDPAFVDELRRSTDADRLGALAARWYADRRPEARRLLVEYLARPLNAIRHEALVKRLFKLAEKAEDDEIVGCFLVAFDRSVRREIHRRHHYDWQTRTRWQEETARVPSGTTMPRPRGPIPSRYEDHRLFSVRTRYYLRRRAWRYFRRLGKLHPERYVPGVAAVLKRYEDEDVATGLALLDNWGLIHILYHHSPELVSKASGWRLGEGRSLAALTPAPMYGPYWQPLLWPGSSAVVVDLLTEARCRPVRQWAIQLLKRDHPGVLANLPLDLLLRWLGHEAPELVMLAAELLRGGTALANVPLERWLAMLETPDATILELLTELMAGHFPAAKVSLLQAVEVARRRPLALARLGFGWLRTKTPATEEDCQALLGLREAGAASLRGDMVGWARGVLGASPFFQPAWVLEYLDSRHREVRDEGWSWLQEEPRARDDVQIWQRLLESPYDDVRLRMLDYLEAQVAHSEKPLVERAVLSPEWVRFLWASVLLNIHRAAKRKPQVVQQLVRRLSRRPEEAGVLLPIVSVALRSVRGPEFRAGLAGVVRLVEHQPELGPVVTAAFPELRLQPVPS